VARFGAEHDQALADLRQRVANTHWPEKRDGDADMTGVARRYAEISVTGTDDSQGVQLATMKELARYWATDYDWRTCEAKLNASPRRPRRSETSRQREGSDSAERRGPRPDPT
jgi:hypothetical protein